MEKKFVLHMNGGNDPVSYANNSSLQKIAISKTQRILDETLKDMFGNNNFAKGLKIIDLGCSSGPNTLLAISYIIDTINKLCKHDHNSLECEVYLNDLLENDFNNLFKMLPSVQQGRKNCFVFGLPGSFYERLLPSKSLHFAYSYNSLHWLSQIPKGVEKNNKENICIARTSPVEVFQAYVQQFQHDFSMFLKCRGEEMVSGGHMVLIFLSRNISDQSSEDIIGGMRLLGETMADMVAEDLIKEDDLYSFNVPMYAPHQEEVEAIIRQEGSFNVNKMELFEVPWDANGYIDDDHEVFDKRNSGKMVADSVRALMEPMLASHFKNAIDIDDIFDRYVQKLAEHISRERPSYLNVVVSLSKG